MRFSREIFGSLVTYPTTDMHLHVHGATTNPPVRWNDTPMKPIVLKCMQFISTGTPDIIESEENGFIKAQERILSFCQNHKK